MASSTVEAEYLALSTAVKEALWLRLLMIELGQGNNPITVYCDNNGCLANLRNPIASSYVKHTDIAYHMVRDQVSAGYIIAEYVPSAENVADLFTKPLDRSTFTKFVERLGMKYSLANTFVLNKYIVWWS